MTDSYESLTSNFIFYLSLKTEKSRKNIAKTLDKD